MKKTASMIIKPSEESRELALYAENTATLYHSRIVPVVRCLAKHLKRGQFDHDRAISAFYPVACDAARMYCREFARDEDAVKVFDVTARYTAAAALLDSFMENIEKNDL